MTDQSIKSIPKPPDLEQLLLSLDMEVKSEEVGARPTWLDAVEKRAFDSGKTVDELLIADRKRLRESNYPGPECFEPHEVEQYANGELSQDRIAHMDDCPSCTGLLRVAVPSEDRLSGLVADIRKAARVAAEDPVKIVAQTKH